MESTSVLNHSIEIRKLTSIHVTDLCTILENNESWKRLMAIIPRTLEKESFTCDIRPSNLAKYHTEQFKQVEVESELSKRMCAEVLLDEWGTSGRVRPTVGRLLYLLKKAGLYRAADYVAVHILREEKPERPRRGPAAAICIELPEPETPRIEALKERKSQERGENNTQPPPLPTPPPQIVVTELPNETPQDPSFSIPLVIQQEHHALSMSEVENLPRISVLLNNQLAEENSVDNNVSDINVSRGANNVSFANPDLDFLLNNSSTSNTSNISSNSSGNGSNSVSVSNNEAIDQSEDVSSNSGFRPDISFLIGSNNPSPLPQLPLNTKLPSFEYDELERTTNGFDERPYKGNVEKGRFLGSGAFSLVFLAVGLMDTPVAVKKLRLEDGVTVQVGDILTTLFRNEVEIFSAHSHKNLLPLLGFSCDGPSYCLVSEYAPGGTLYDRLHPPVGASHLCWETRLAVAHGTASALAYLHSAGLVHRDVKTTNILLGAGDEARLGDFGVDTLPMDGMAVFGTAAYMAPEAHATQDSDKLDVFAFGVVLLEMLTGRPPVHPDDGDIVTFVEEKCEDNNITPLLDATAGSWSKSENDYSKTISKVTLVEEKCENNNITPPRNPTAGSW